MEKLTNEAFLDGLGAQRIPDPTTSGDFTLRFDHEAIVDLMEAINNTRQRVWKKQPLGFVSHAFIDTDGTIAPTLGECKGGIGLSYKGISRLCAFDYHVGEHSGGALPS